MSDTAKLAQEALRIIDSGKFSYGQNRDEGYLDDKVMDCSEFVYHAYRNAGFMDFPALNSHSMATRFQEVDDEQDGNSERPKSTLTVQRVLARPHWRAGLSAEDLRVLTPLTWEHANPYGTYQLDLDTRLVLD